MNKIDKTKPVSSIHHDDKRAAIPDSAHQGEEQMAISGQPEQSEYDIFRHEFQRGRDPELYWLGKYKNDDEDNPEYMPQLRTDIQSLYKHEDIRPEAIIDNLYELHEHDKDPNALRLDLFVDEGEEDELERLAGYYKHSDNWQNRLIQGDSLLVMNSLLNREGMKGQVQCIYIDPPYGIKYGGNWQMRINSTNVKESDEGMTGEPEMIKAYRDTWELGIHSYLSYLRDRLVLSRELLTESGSCFVQISDENVHLVRNILDDVFGSENCVSQLVYKKTSGAGSPAELLSPASVCDYILWYAKDLDNLKFRKLYILKEFNDEVRVKYNGIELKDGERMPLSEWEERNNEQFNYYERPKGSKVFRIDNITSQSGSDTARFPVEVDGRTFTITHGSWKTSKEGMNRLRDKGRLYITKNDKLGYVRYFDDFPAQLINNMWDDVYGIQSRSDSKVYVVQSGTKAVQRCILMTTDPGDLVLDPTCGSGTTAYVAEQWGRRWITIDTSRIALNIAKKRLTTALFPYYKTFDDSENPNIRRGFVYKKVPHITLKALANDLPFDEETLYDQPEEDKKRIRVSGPFTVETLQSLDVSSPESLNDKQNDYDEYAAFTERIFNNLTSNGIRNGVKQQQAVMHSMEHLDEPYLNAKGYFKQEDGTEHCVYFMIGPKFGTVSKHAVNEAVRAFRQHLDESNWLVILGFSFEDTIESGENKDYNFGTFQVSKVRMSDDLLQDGLLKKDKKAGSFIIIGEPDIILVNDGDGTCHVEINGMDMYDPIQDEVKARNVNDIAYWEMDDNYTGGLFKVRSIHFCGGDKKDFDAWRKGLNTVAADYAKSRAERTLKLEFNEEVWEKLYDFKSEPIQYEKGRKVAVRVVSQFGEESTKILEM
jgi:adenine-specific DNA-methyltransferase